MTTVDSKRWSLEVVGLTRFSNKKISGLLFRPQKFGYNNSVVVSQAAQMYDVNIEVINNLFECCDWDVTF